MERLSYGEAKSWFWLRTRIWFIPAAAVSVASWYFYVGEAARSVGPRFWLSLASGVGVAAVGLFAAWVSIQLPWMRQGWRSGFVLNGLASAGAALAAAFLACGVILSAIHGDPRHPPSREAVSAGYALIQFGVAEAAFWGFVFGSWFALRRDRYFVERV